MTRTRRAVLGAVAGSALALAGCVSRPGSRADGSAETDAPTETESTPEPTATADEAAVADESSGDGAAGEGESRSTGTSEPVRGEADPITVDRTITDADLEYLEDDHEVKYVAAWRHANPTAVSEGEPPEREPVYETIPFEDWAATECATVGAEAVGEAIREAIDGDAGVGAGITRRDGAVVITVNQSTTLNREGEVVSEPSVPFERVVAAAPRSVAATVRLADQEHTRTVPVWVEEVTLRYD